MDKTDRLIQQTERLLEQVETLQQAVRQLRIDLDRHVLSLAQELAKPRKTPAASPKSAQPRERRSTSRRRGNPVSVAIGNGSHAESFEGWVLDRSSGGLRLLVDEAVSAGSLLKVRPSKAPSGTRWVHLKVKSCYPERNSWNLGCQFVEKLSWEDLQQFG